MAGELLKYNALICIMCFDTDPVPLDVQIRGVGLYSVCLFCHFATTQQAILIVLLTFFVSLCAIYFVIGPFSKVNGFTVLHVSTSFLTMSLMNYSTVKTL